MKNLKYSIFKLFLDEKDKKIFDTIRNKRKDLSFKE